MNHRTTLAVSLVSFALGFAVAWLANSDGPPAPLPAVASPAPPPIAAADLDAVARALADENQSLREEIELREQLNEQQRLRIDALEALVEEQPKEL